jgi:hypothetical protein
MIKLPNTMQKVAWMEALPINWLSLPPFGAEMGSWYKSAELSFSLPHKRGKWGAPEKIFLRPGTSGHC